MPWSHRGARAASTHFVKVQGESARPKGKNPILVSFAPESEPQELPVTRTSRDWPLVCLELLDRCPDTEDRQETTDVAAREIPEGVARLSAPLRFWAERTERGTRGRPLRPGALAGLAERSPEGAEERRTLCNAVHPALPSPAGAALNSPEP